VTLRSKIFSAMGLLGLLWLLLPTTVRVTSIPLTAKWQAQLTYASSLTHLRRGPQAYRTSPACQEWLTARSLLLHSLPIFERQIAGNGDWEKA